MGEIMFSKKQLATPSGNVRQEHNVCSEMLVQYLLIKHVKILIDIIFSLIAPPIGYAMLFYKAFRYKFNRIFCCQQSNIFVIGWSCRCNIPENALQLKFVVKVVIQIWGAEIFEFAVNLVSVARLR